MLSADEMRRFAETGYLGPFDLPADVQSRFAGQDYLERVRMALASGLPREQMRNQHLYSRSLLEFVSVPAILDRVRAILGDDVLLWVAHYMAREPDSGGQKWHTDAINQYTRGLHVSIAMTDMTQANGCLSLIPGSHLYRPSLWAREQAGLLDRFDSDAVRAFADREAWWNAPHDVRPMALHAGQFFFTWGGLWHFVSPNRTPQTRIACVARYVRTDFRCCDHGYRDDRIEPGDPQPCVLVHGQDRFGLNDVRARPDRDLFD